MGLSKLMFLLVLLHNRVSVSEVRIGLSEQHVWQHTQAVLSCIFTTDATFCRWSLNGVGIEFDTYPKSVYQLPVDKSKGNCTLTIPKVNYPRDNGSWVCFIPRTFTHEAIAAPPIYLTVLVRPAGPMIYSSKALHVPGSKMKFYAGEKQNVSCLTKFGYPVGIFRWKLNDDSLISGRSSINVTIAKDLLLNVNHTYEIEPKRHMDGSVLTCELQLVPDAPIIDSYVMMDVRYTTTYVKIKNELKIITREGYPVTLFCEADGNPLPDYQWMHQIPDTSNWTIVDVQANYSIRSVTKKDAGYYLCLAGNRALIPSQQLVLVLLNGEGLTMANSIIIATVVCTTLVIGCAVGIIIFLKHKWHVKRQLPPQPYYLDMKPPESVSSLMDIKSLPLPSLPMPVDPSGYLIPNFYVAPDPLTPPQEKKQDGVDSISTTSAASHLYEDPKFYDDIKIKEESVC